MLCYVMLCYVNSMRLSPLYVTTSKKQISAIVFAARCISAAYAVMRCVCVSVSVCVSVTFVSCVKTNKDIFEIFFHHRAATPL